MYDVTSAKTLE